MLIVVTTVSALVHLYCWGYMADDDSKPRFFAYLSFFTFAMLALVTAADFMQLFFGWEGVGLASYLLIGFWYKKPTANAAAIKAFVVNRVGDFGFALGIITTFWVFGTIRFAEIFPQVAAHANQAWQFGGWTFNAVDLACCLLFVGAMGKSAQFFLHTWLPDAMEGPTPVSALIHAATMVTAGVYMVCLLSPMFEYAPIAKAFVTIIGAITALFAATVGLAQNDIKRVIAYSTCSQLGYMFLAAGVGAYQGAMFHLFTHAFFKAPAVPGRRQRDHRHAPRAGHAEDGRPLEADADHLRGHADRHAGDHRRRHSGPGAGLRRLLLEGRRSSTPPISPRCITAGPATYAFIIGVLAAGLTSFYSWRLIFMTFHGTPKWAHADGHHHDHAAAHADPDEEPSAHDDHGPIEPHESRWVMLVPLLVLAIGAVIAGYVFDDWFIGADRDDFWRGAIFNLGQVDLAEPKTLPEWVVWAPLVVTAIGFVSAWWVYIRHEGMGARIAARKGPIWSFLYNKWYFDELYDATFVRADPLAGRPVLEGRRPEDHRRAGSRRRLGALLRGRAGAPGACRPATSTTMPS